MTNAPFYVVVEAVVYLAILLTAFGGFAFALWIWRSDPRKLTLPTWRRIVTNVGFLAVTGQAAMLIASWTRIGRDYVLFGEWARLVVPSFLVALPCVLAGKGPSRWWLLSSSVLLFVICFFMLLSA
jgi:hypothetical protein